MAWRWKSTVSHTNITDLLKFVKDFMGGCSSIVTDNCCSDRPIIQEILGDNTLVLLDLFHAIQRFGT